MKTRFTYLLTFVFALLSPLMFAQAQTIQISGAVLDEDNVPLAGASIVIQGTATGTSTDFDGNFSLDVEVGDVLEFSFLGYRTATMIVEFGKDTYDINLMQDGNLMDEIVVVAYGAANKESITGAVSSINADQITKRPLTNAVSALEGSAAGIQVNNTGGQPGDEPEIRIRGFTTINGSNSPLYVIDGVPFSGNFSDINPSDVKSISVLKDASAAALYGNRASNGVILIQTKGGEGAKGMNVSVKQGFYNRGISEYDKLGPDEFMEVMYQGYKHSLMTSGNSEADATSIAANSLVDDILGLNIYNVSNDQLFTSDGKLNPSASIYAGYLGDLDWFKPVERTGYRQEYNVNASNGNDKGNIYMSLNYLDEDGYFKKSDYNRITANIKAEYQATDWLKFGSTLRGSYQERNEFSQSSSTAFVNPFFYARNIAPIYPVHSHDPQTGEYTLDEEGNKIYDNGESSRKQYVGRHAIEEHFLNTDRSYRNTLNGQVFAEISFLQDFTFTIKGDLNLRNSEDQSYDNSKIGDGQGNDGRAKRIKYRYKNYTGQQLLAWNRSFDNHNVDVLLGHENYSSFYQYLYGYKTNEIFFGEAYLDNFTEITDLYDYGVSYKTEGYFGRAKYNFDEKYYVEASFRRDGSSKFAKSKRWGNFWSVGGSWILSKEDFFNVDFVDELKIRGSYGEVGNDSGAGNYAYQALYAVNQNDNIAALYKNQNGAPDLKWETSSSIGFGIEARLFDRVNFSAEYFDKRSKNLLFDVNLPLSSGSTSFGSAAAEQTMNLGTISNEGVELALDVDIIRNDDWTWNVGANATFMKNRIKKLPEANRENGIIDGNYKYDEGKSIYEFFTYQYQGVDQMTGNALYTIDDEAFNVNGSNPDADPMNEDYLVEIDGVAYTTNTTYGKRDWSGSAIPDVYGSFNTSLSWKNFNLSALFTYQVGGKVYDSSYASLMSVGATPGAIHQDILKAWNGTPDGVTESSANRIDKNGVPVVDYDLNTYNSAMSDRFLQDASYLVFKNITLGYNFPRNLVDNLGLKSLNVNLSADNLVTFTKLKGMNPQYSFAGSSSNYAVTPRIFTFGINVGF